VLIGIVLGLVALVVYWRSNPAPVGGYEHFVYQADAFLHGRLDMVGVPDYYQDLALWQGKIYLPMPPGPALVLLPFVALFGIVDALEAQLAILLGALDVALAYWMLLRVGASTRSAVFGALLLGFSSVLWSAAALGTSWFFAHLVAVAFVLLGLGELGGKGRGWLVGVLFALAWLTRAPIVMAAPFAFVALWTRSRRQALWFGAVATLSLVAYGVFNYARFGDALESGHHLHTAALALQGPLSQGLFALVHLPPNLDALLLRGFDVVPDVPFFKPSPYGLSIVLTSPALLALLFPERRPNRGEWALLGCALVVLAPSLFWFSTGWVQWGYRYALDSLPFLLVALARLQSASPRGMEWGLLVVGIAVNAMGVYWLRTLGS